MISSLHPASSRLCCVVTSVLQDRRGRVAPYAFRILRNAVSRSTCTTCLHRCGVHRALLAGPEVRSVRSRDLCLRTDASLERAAERSWLLLVLSPVTRLFHNKASASTNTPAVSKRRMCHKESLLRRPEGFVPSVAQFSSARTASTTGVTAPTRAPGSCTTTPEAGNANTSVPAVADFLVNMVKKQIRSDSGIITPQTELESLLMRDDRHWDCLDTVEFLLDVEELFNVFIPDEVADCFRTIQEIADFVTKHRTEAAGDGAQGEVKDGKKLERLAG